MPCNTIKPANSGKTAQLQISAKLLEELIPIRIKNNNCVASPCRAAALSAASRLVLLSNANWNNTRPGHQRAHLEFESRCWKAPE